MRRHACFTVARWFGATSHPHPKNRQNRDEKCVTESALRSISIMGDKQPTKPNPPTLLERALVFRDEFARCFSESACRFRNTFVVSDDKPTSNAIASNA